jgi:hypothetical protein
VDRSNIFNSLHIDRCSNLLVSLGKRHVGTSTDRQNYFDDFERLRLRGIDETRVSITMV